MAMTDEGAFDYKIIWAGSYESFETAVDGLVTDIRYVKDLNKEGRLRFELPPGNKHVTIYLPADATALAADFPENARKLAEAIWPGPMTLVLKKKPVVLDPWDPFGSLAD